MSRLRQTAVVQDVPINAAGGVLVTSSEIEAAFRFLDPTGKGKISMGVLRQKLGAFFPDMPLSEVKFLLGDKKEMTVADLHALLDGNEITNFDPVAEAFKCWDPHGTGFADIATCRAIFARLGMDLSDEDVKVLVSTADGDKDGAVSLSDFRDMLRRATVKRDEEAAAAAAAEKAAALPSY